MSWCQVNISWHNNQIGQIRVLWTEMNITSLLNCLCGSTLIWSKHDYDLPKPAKATLGLWVMSFCLPKLEGWYILCSQGFLSCLVTSWDLYNQIFVPTEKVKDMKPLLGISPLKAKIYIWNWTLNSLAILEMASNKALCDPQLQHNSPAAVLRRALPSKFNLA